MRPRVARRAQHNLLLDALFLLAWSHLTGSFPGSTEKLLKFSDMANWLLLAQQTVCTEAGCLSALQCRHPEALIRPGIEARIVSLPNEFIW